MRPDPEERQALLAIGHPYFSRCPWDDRLGRVAVVIEATTDWVDIAELVTDSYRVTAPKKLVAQLDASTPPLGASDASPPLTLRVDRYKESARCQ